MSVHAAPLTASPAAALPPGSAPLPHVVRERNPSWVEVDFQLDDCTSDSRSGSSPPGRGRGVTLGGKAAVSGTVRGCFEGKSITQGARS